MKDIEGSEIKQFHVLKSKDDKEWMAFKDVHGWSYKDISQKDLNGIVFFLTSEEIEVGKLRIIGRVMNQKKILKKCSYIVHNANNKGDNNGN